MASKVSSAVSAGKSEPPAAVQIDGVKEGVPTTRDILSVIDSLKKQVVSDRCILIKKRIEENKQKLSGITQHIYNMSKFRRNNTAESSDAGVDLLTRRQNDALCMLNNLDISCTDKDSSGYQEESSHTPSAILFGQNFGGKNSIRPIKLAEMPKLPPYTTWIFLDRNQRMAEDQSVVGRRRIYYDQSCGEALICSDSEEDIVDEEDDKKAFVNIEDYILRLTIQEVGLSDLVLDSLSQCLDKGPSEIKARYENISVSERSNNCGRTVPKDDKIEDSFLEKDLDAALDSFDNLFCRRCLVFDCRLHGCSQDLVFPSEKQLPWSCSDDGSPCGIHCYRLASKSESNATVNSQMPRVPEELSNSNGSAGTHLSPRKKSCSSSIGRRVRSNQSESASLTARAVSESSESEVRHCQEHLTVNHSSPPKTNLGVKSGKKNNKRVAERVLGSLRKKQKQVVPSDSDSVVKGSIAKQDMKLRSKICYGKKGSASSLPSKVSKKAVKKSKKKKLVLHDGFDSTCPEVPNETHTGMIKETPATDGDEVSRKEFVGENIYKGDSCYKSWRTFEKGLVSKGIEIFGRNSCLIARNLLSGLKTCMEIYHYLNFIENKAMYCASDGSHSLVEGHAKGMDVRARSRFVRRRGRVRRLKYTWKSAGYHSIRKRISERKDQPCRQYNPCGCQSACGKQCPCILNGTCCEKYCGCPKICKNRFRGCHCAKSQCRSRQCPCFAADRECDPDVCRNCWVGCGDGSFGGPVQLGDNYECRNMKLLLKQQQRVLLGGSDISGWGAFLKNSVGKHEYLGEYTGELISHREADKRGKIYDRENSSFLFNLNDQFVLDAYRKGDKLKFANHSPEPNCYAKVIMVAGDHRVGIFAKERIGAGEELFYDYRYEPDRAPAWARKPEASGSKKEEAGPSTGRAKKLA
ncbi:histone-lysine N-methyltransferase EZ1 isoform X1 [Dendrobium catenatum]|uniref:Histone-lysine N-methyltransferase EZ1 n=2 Tax=Dendrobium catenatum TaxID=906689 RepID=A0A2I0XCE6_9ASPA|nr:histone-lysine N-methyltransferase EZ1 isoform X1 [Dendrobium catenatum]PKU85579.1 Histone-lysine N-methyltransferase EZ1 [Dendrobium catenatum]